MAVNVGSMFASLTVDTQQFIRGMGRADKLTGTTMESIRRSSSGAAKSLDGLTQVFGSTGLASGVRVFQDINRQATALPASFRTAAVALAGLGGVFSGAALLKSLDTFTGLQNQLRSLGGGLGTTGSQFEALLGVADRSRTSIDAVVTLFTRLAKAQPGATFEKTARSVETITKALALGGATAEEAASAAIQFSQAIASGRLGGDELRAVLESPLGNALAKGLGVTIGKLRELSTQGKLTSEAVLGALEKVGPEIDAKFSKSVQTVGQSFTLLQNQIIATVGKLDQSFGASRIISSGIMTIADNLDSVANAALAAALAIGSISAGRLGGGGVSAISNAFKSLGENARSGVAEATNQIKILESALQRAQQERGRLNSLIGPSFAGGNDKFSKAIDLSNRRIAEITSVLPQARTQLGLAEKAATKFGMALSGARAVGGSLVAFMGGPWGIAFAAAAAGVALLAAKQAEATQRAIEYEEVADRLLNKVAKFDSVAGDFAAKDKATATLTALQKDASVAKSKVRDVLSPLNGIGEKIDDLRRRQLEFIVNPDAVRATEVLRAEIEKVVNGGSLRQFNIELEKLKQNAGRPTTEKDNLFEQARAAAARAAEAVKVLSIAQDQYKRGQKDNGKTADAVSSPEAAVNAASEKISTIAVNRAKIDAALFAMRVDEIKSKELSIANSLSEAITKSGGTLTASLKKYVDNISRIKALTDQVTVAGIAQRDPFAVKDNPYVRYPPGQGPNAPLEQGNQAIQLAKLLDMANQRRQLQETLDAEKQTIGGTGGLLKDMFGTSADSAGVKGALSGVEADVKRVFEEFRTGKINAVEAFNQIQNIRTTLEKLGAQPAPLTAFMEQISSAITGIPTLAGQIVELTNKMRALADESLRVRMPGARNVGKIVLPPDATDLPGYASGGAFKVGGGGGTDSRLVQFMASPTETVAVFTPSQLRALNDNGATGGGLSVHAPITIVANDATSFRGSRRQVQMDIADAMQAVVNRTR